jgi:hypothetical protein
MADTGKALGWGIPGLVLLVTPAVLQRLAPDDEPPPATEQSLTIQVPPDGKNALLGPWSSDERPWVVRIYTGSEPAAPVAARLASESGSNWVDVAVQDGDAADGPCKPAPKRALPADPSAPPTPSWCLIVPRDQLHTGSAVTGVITDAAAPGTTATTALTLTLQQKDRWLLVPFATVLIGFVVAVVAGIWTKLFGGTSDAWIFVSGLRNATFDTNKPFRAVVKLVARIVGAVAVLVFSFFGVAVASYTPNATFGTWTDYFALFSAAVGWAGLSFVIGTVSGLFDDPPASRADKLEQAGRALGAGLLATSDVLQATHEWTKQANAVEPKLPAAQPPEDTTAIVGAKANEALTTLPPAPPAKA